MGSTRLPGKVMQKIGGTPMIELLLRRLSRSNELTSIVVATSSGPENLPLLEHVRALGYACELGSEADVLERYVLAARAHQADIVVRITGDCPLVDPELVDECIQRFKQTQVDYFSNVSPPTYPDGLDVEVVKMTALELALTEARPGPDHEHVTPYIRESGRCKSLDG